jgi:signal transduction histidine kinase
MSAAIALLEVAVTANQLAAVRTRTREVGELLGLDGMQQTRFSTAVSEIARNAVQHGGGGGVVRFAIDQLPSAAGQAPVQRLLAEVRDHGPGLRDAAAAMEGRRRSDGRLTMGLVGTARLVDVLEIEAPSSGGTLVRVGVHLPRTNAPLLDAAAIAVVTERLKRRAPASPAEELEHQNGELLRTLQVLREKQAELEAADQRKNDFVAMLAHELRNPLATLEMNLEILHRKPQMPAGELAERGAVMRRQTRQLTQLVADLMDATQVSQGKVTLRKEPTELNDLVAQALETSSGAIDAKHHLVVSQPSAEPAWVSGDAGRLRQVLSNLLQNSARYTPAGGRIVVRVTQDVSHAQVAVQDNGMGIAADDLPHVFGLFVQGDAARSHQEGGLGVGLALVQRLVNDHGGKVVMASEGLNLGCTVTVQLPLIAAPA